MKPFLDSVIEDILKNHPADFSELCVVFPSRRAALIFRKKFAAHLDKPAWSPAVMSVEDFINSLSTVPVAEDVELLFELFEVYKQFFPEMPFEKYFHWGEMMLSDFNEIDLQLADANKLFTHISDLKRIESEFGLAEEDAERIAGFWKNFSGKELSALKSEFKTTWDALPKIYHAFKNHLQQNGIGYEGMAFQNVLEQLRNGMQLKWNKIIFAGFYSLNRAHEEIIAELKKKDKVTLYWDADRYYSEDETQEAGNYFRRRNLLDKNFKWNENYFGREEKNITMTGVPLQVGQAKYLGSVMDEQISKKSFEENNTAVVLPDENLLFPVLYSMPSALKSFNVTMGYPLKKSLVSGLMQTLYSMHKHILENEKKGISFYSMDVINLLEHPYVQHMDETFPVKKIKEINDTNKIFCSAKDFAEAKNELKSFFRKLNSATEVFDYIIETLKSIAGNNSDKDRLNNFDREIVLFIKTELEKVYEIITPHISAINSETAWQFIRKTVDKLKIPFSGEPVQGLQIMGFLETRALDFENLFILSVNEDILPASSKGNSYIPYSLRKAFGLPTFEEQDAVHAYHFYRLLQRAKNVHLIYNTEVKSLTGGEKSRYLLQLEYEMKKKFGNKLKIHHSLVSTGISTDKAKSISVEKNKEVMEILESRFVKRRSEELIGFSASALSTYINCPLQFYFRYIARIKENDEVEENIEADTFGKILHSAMKLLYNNIKELTPEISDEILKQVDAAVNESYIKEFSKSADEPVGKNYLLRQAIAELVKKIIEADKKIAPFTIEATEATFEHHFKYNPAQHGVLLKGIFDRVDSTGEFFRIVDYKTGSDELNPRREMKEVFSTPKLKATFQLYYYSYIYARKHHIKKLRPAIYRTKSISEGLSYLYEDADSFELKLQDFEYALEELLSEIMNPEKPFLQTSDEKKCRNCPYKEICNR